MPVYGPDAGMKERLRKKRALGFGQFPVGSAANTAKPVGAPAPTNPADRVAAFNRMRGYAGGVDPNQRQGGVPVNADSGGMTNWRTPMTEEQRAASAPLFQQALANRQMPTTMRGHPVNTGGQTATQSWVPPPGFGSGGQPVNTGIGGGDFAQGFGSMVGGGLREAQTLARQRAASNAGSYGGYLQTPENVRGTLTGPNALPTRSINRWNNTGQVMNSGPWNDPSFGGNVNYEDNASGYYDGMGEFAQEGIGGVRPYQPGANPAADAAFNTFNQYAGQRAPQPGSAPTSYQHQNAPGFRDPSYDEMNFGRYDGSGITGPGRGQYTDPRDVAAGIGGPQTDYDRLYSETQRGAVNRVGDLAGLGGGFGREATGVGREAVPGSGYRSDETFANPESVSRRGFEAGLAGSEQAQGASLDDDVFRQGSAAIKAELDANRRASGIQGQRDVGGKGIVYEPGTGVSDEAFGLHYAPALAASERQLQELGERNIDRTIQQRQFGTTTAAGIGGSAAEAAQGFGKLGQEESQFGIGANLEQRRGDIDQQGQRISERGQDINRQLEERGQNVTTRGQDVTQRQHDLSTEEGRANRALDVERLRNENYQSQTQRMTGMGSLVNQMEEARANNDVQGYQAATQRLQTEYGYDADMARNQIAGYQAATQRGEVGQRAWAAAQQIGLDYAGLNQRYDEMGARNLQTFNDQLLNAFSGDTDRMTAMTNGMTRLAEMDQQGQIEAGRQAIDYGGLMRDIMRDGSNVQQAADQLALQASQGNRAAFMELYTFYETIGEARDQARYAREDANKPGRIIAGIVSGGVNAYASARGARGGGG